MTAQSVDLVADRLAAFGAEAQKAAEAAVAAEAQDLRADGLAIQPGPTPLEVRIIAPRSAERRLLQVLANGSQSLSQRLSAALAGLMGQIR